MCVAADQYETGELNQPIGDKDTQFQNGIQNIECALPFTIHIHDRSGKFESIWY